MTKHELELKEQQRRLIEHAPEERRDVANWAMYCLGSSLPGTFADWHPSVDEIGQRCLTDEETFQFYRESLLKYLEGRLAEIESLKLDRTP